MPRPSRTHPILIGITTFGLVTDLHIDNATDDVMQELKDRGLLEDYTMLVDARLFADSWSEHSGTHPRIITRLISHDCFAKFLRKVRRVFDREVAAWTRGPFSANPQPFTIGVFCRSGKHRSVAVAQVLVHVISSLGYVAVWNPIDDTRLCRCSECSGSRFFTLASLSNALDLAIDIWRS